MKKRGTIDVSGRSSLGAFVVLAGFTLLAGCQSYDNTYSAVMGSGSSVTATDSARLTKSGFLSDYARLKANPAADGIECWRDASVDARQFDKAMVSNILVSIAPPSKDQTPEPIDPSDLKVLTDYFHGSLSKALQQQMQLTDKAGPGVIVIRIALTDLVPTSVLRSTAGTLTPYGFVAEAGSGVASGRPAGSTPYLGETGVEMQFLDGGTAKVIGECRDTQIGRKYAADVNASTVGAAQTWASGYLNSFQSWSYARNAFDKWSLLIARRFAELRTGAH